MTTVGFSIHPCSTNAATAQGERACGLVPLIVPAETLLGGSSVNTEQFCTLVTQIKNLVLSGKLHVQNLGSPLHVLQISFPVCEEF